jgi:hypothetical protein
MARKRHAVSTGSWMMFAEAFTPELTESHVYIKSSHAKLRHFIEEVERLGVERDSYNSRKLEATRKRNKMIVAGNRLVAAMQLALRDHLGPDNEQLTAFGIKPFRGKKRVKKETDAETPPQESADPPET